MSPTRLKYLADIEFAKRRALTDFYFFCNKVLHYDLMVPHVHEEMCNFLVHDIPRESNEQSTKILLEARGTFKSTIGTVAYPLWRLVRNPDLTILLNNEKQQRVADFLRAIKNHITDNDAFITLFGDLSCQGKMGKRWNENRIDIATRKVWGANPSIDTASVTSSTVGKHADLIINDDLVGESNVGTQDQLAKVDEFVKNLGAVLNPGGEMNFIGTRWHHMDTYNTQMEHIKTLGKHAKADVLIRSAYNDDGTLFFPERLSETFLNAQRVKLQTYFFSCTPKETPILMGDWNFKEIADVRVGDEVIGYEVGNGVKKHHFQPAIVTEINSRVAPVYEYTMKSGRFVRCTEEHQWYNSRSGRDGFHRMYSPTDVGRHLRFVTPISLEATEQDLIDYAYLAGIIDGEGACQYGSIFIHQSWEHNPEVCKKIREVLDRLGLPYADKGDYLYLTGGAEIKEKIIRLGKPARAFQIIGTMNTSAWMVREKDKVVSKRLIGNKRVYALTTTTGNYIAWGYASKNCQYLNSPVNRDNALIQNIEKYSDLIDEMPAHEFFRKRCNIFVTMDIAYTDTKRSDHTVIFITAVNVETGKRYVVDFHIFKTTAPQKVIDRMFEVQEFWSPIRWGIESNNYKSWLRVPLGEAMRNRNIFLNIDPEEGLMHYGKSNAKHLRMAKLAPVYNNGMCVISEKMTDLEDQLLILTYDGTKGHDDLLDAHAMQEEIIFWGSSEPANKYDNEAVSVNLKDDGDDFLDKRYPDGYSRMGSDSDDENAWLCA